MKKMFLLIFALSLASWHLTAFSFDLDFGLDPDVLPHFHRTPKPVKPEDELVSLSCEEIDEAITYLIPEEYQYKPDFYDDGYNSVGIWGSTVSEFGIDQIAYLYLPYSWFQTYLEEGRQHDTFYQLEKLRRAKAIKQCYVQ